MSFCHSIELTPFSFVTSLYTQVNQVAIVDPEPTSVLPDLLIDKRYVLPNFLDSYLA